MAVYADVGDLASLGLDKEILKRFTVVKQTEQLEAASARIDSYLATRFVLPLVSFGKDLTEACCIISSYYLMVSSAAWNPVPGSADEHLYLRFKDIIKWLEGIPKNLVTPIDIIDSGTVDGDDGLIPMIDSDPPRGW